LGRELSFKRKLILAESEVPTEMSELPEIFEFTKLIISCKMDRIIQMKEMAWKIEQLAKPRHLQIAKVVFAIHNGSTQ
jgi:hypothetical protein